MLRSKLESRLRGLILFAVVAVIGAVVTGHPAQPSGPSAAADTSAPTACSPAVTAVASAGDETACRGVVILRRLTQ